ncbi:MAG: hypothetical protein J2P24_19965 [Streptosporangiales bacterium]|nr:hypothetical protein [Streptosporangiales bacterium]MBO0890616.1 hypothetical protein [Acidothermales bacterium]
MSSREVRRPRGQPLLGIVIALGGLAALAVPAFFTTMLAYAGFSGCLLECTRRHPVLAVVWTLDTVVLVAAPVVAGVLVAVFRPVPRVPLYALAGVVVLGLACLAI